MPLIEVLVAAMNREENNELYNQMNLRTSAVIANQCDKFSYFEQSTAYGELKIVSTPQRGVGKNRNTALLHSSADILVFADEDMVYNDDYEETILKAFDELKDADLIVFDIVNTDPKGKKQIRIEKTARLSIKNSLRYGAARVAVKRESLMKANVWFSLLFGGGSKYGSGEDTIFITDCIKKGLKLYCYPKTIATVNQGTSTWFEGINEKFFRDKGALLKSVFPKSILFIAAVFAFKYKKLTKEYSVFTIYKLLIGRVIL